MTPEQIKLIQTRWHDWHTADWDYAQTTVEFFCVGIAIMLIFTVCTRLRNWKNARRSSETPRSANVVDRTMAVFRFFAYRQVRMSLCGWYSPPLASIIAVCGIFTFLMALLLGARPYYWPNAAMGHSPPIATRSGWISVAILPFMIAFATKVNFIGILTGTSHERLQVFHRWTALFMWITSLVHTFPFIINNIRMGRMTSQWKNSSFYWSGVAALVPQSWLVLMSWGVVRSPYYELFKKMHFIAAAVFISALFIHVNFLLTSWDYFWATTAMYWLAWFIRFIKTLYNGPSGLPAIIEALPDEMVRVTVDAPARLKWVPGQHVFLRFLKVPGLHALTSHPFTVANLPCSIGEDEALVEARKLEVVFSAKAGITKVLAGMADGKMGTTRVLVDGPYGGLPVSLRTFDRVCLLAGGSGATFTFPLLMDLVQGFSTGMTCRCVEFILVVKRAESYLWMKDELVQAAKQANVNEKGTSFAAHIYITRESEPNSPANEDAKSESNVEEHFTDVEEHIGRPSIRAIVRNACQSDAGGRIAFAACGPDSLMYDVRNAVAQCELDVADGFARCQDIFLHAENYSW